MNNMSSEKDYVPTDGWAAENKKLKERYYKDIGGEEDQPVPDPRDEKLPDLSFSHNGQMGLVQDVKVNGEKQILGPTIKQQMDKFKKRGLGA